MKNQALFSSKDKIKKLKCHLLQFLFGALTVNGPLYVREICLNISNFPMCAGFSLTSYLESFTPTFGLGTPVFPRISSNLHCGTPTFSKRCLWDSYF